MPKEMDIVPAIHIKDFWPDDVKRFLDRLKANCPSLYETNHPNGIDASHR